MPLGSVLDDPSDPASWLKRFQLDYPVVSCEQKPLVIRRTASHQR